MDALTIKDLVGFAWRDFYLEFAIGRGCVTATYFSGLEGQKKSWRRSLSTFLLGLLLGSVMVLYYGTLHFMMKPVGFILPWGYFLLILFPWHILRGRRAVAVIARLKIPNILLTAGKLRQPFFTPGGPTFLKVLRVLGLSNVFS